jgi:hypothetical protein
MIRSADKNMTAQHYIRTLMRNLMKRENEAKEYRKYIDLYKMKEAQELYISMKVQHINIE